MEELPFLIRGGRVLGQDHRIANRNCQDGFAFSSVEIGGRVYFVGAVSDGCSEAEQSEVAASLLPQFVVKQVAHLIDFETPVLQIPISLYTDIRGFLDSLAKMLVFRDSRERVNFIQNFLLATVIGFVIGPEEGIVFHAGDGYIVINDKIIKLDYNNASPYPAYHLLPKSALIDGARMLPRTFGTIELKTTDLQTLMIATDGFSEQLLRRVLKEAFPVPLGVQLWLNKINGPRNPNPQDGIFHDDAAVVILERSEEVKTNA